MMMYNVNDTYGGRILDLYGEISDGETRLFRQMLAPGMTAVEVGANIGTHTLVMAQSVGPGGRVLAFEPQRSVFQILCGNLALNGLEQVEPWRAALGAESGTLVAPRLDPRVRHNFGGLELGSGAPVAGDRVPLLTLDSFDLPALHFMKVDAEGMEHDVLRGARQTLTKFKPLLYVENDRLEKSAALIQFLETLDYRLYWSTPPYVDMPNFYNNPDNIFPGVVALNLLCVHRDATLVIDGFEKVEGPDDNFQKYLARLHAAATRGARAPVDN
jgi:FkbM family methyltransferase